METHKNEHRMKQTHKARLEEMAHDRHEFCTMIGYLGASSAIDITDRKRLQKAAEHAQRIQMNIHHLTKRGNVLLQMALQIAGMEKCKEWKLEVDDNSKFLLREATELGENNRIRFSLSVPPKAQWKGNIKQCPLLRIMPMTFPVRWLDMPSGKVRGEMEKLFRA